MTYDQSDFEIRCEWGEQGASRLAPSSDAVVIVDVMSFSTAVTVAVARGAIVYPYRWKDDSRIAFAKSVNAELAGPRSKGTYSLSPLSLMTLKQEDRIVLPSPNGATLSLATGTTLTFAGCLRNASSVAKAAMSYGRRISVIACGEKWQDDGGLRPAYEDLMGAGAAISHLKGSRSPEASAALATFEAGRENLLTLLEQCSSGRELIERGFSADISAVAELNVDDVAPILRDGAYTVAQ